MTSDDDDDEEEEDKGQEEQAVQPVASVEQPWNVPPRPKYILMDYNKSMGDGVIPDNKVLRLKNCWCYTILDPVFWGENSIDRCPTYGVCWVCCSSGPTGRYCQNLQEQGRDMRLYFDYIENNRGEEITRMVDAQWISHIFEATQIDAQVIRVQETHLIYQWGNTPMEWLKNKVINKYHDMRTRGLMTGTDNKIKSRAIRMTRLIRKGFLEEEKNGDYDFPLNQVRVLGPRGFLYRQVW
jgi:hypothetical protein